MANFRFQDGPQFIFFLQQGFLSRFRHEVFWGIIHFVAAIFFLDPTGFERSNAWGVVFCRYQILINVSFLCAPAFCLQAFLPPTIQREKERHSRDHKRKRITGFALPPCMDTSDSELVFPPSYCSRPPPISQDKAAPHPRKSLAGV